MDILLITETESGSNREVDEALRPFFIYDGHDTPWTSDNDATSEFSWAYQHYFKDRAMEIAQSWLWRTLRIEPKSFKEWLLQEGIPLRPLSAPPSANKDSYGLLDEKGNVASVWNRNNYDEFAKSGGLIHGARIFTLPFYVKLLDDGKSLPLAPHHRQRLMLSPSVLLSDAQDAAINIWQYWERRHNDLHAAPNKMPFDKWRQEMANDRRSFPNETALYDVHLADIPAECAARWEFVNSAFIVRCDAMVKDGLWWEPADDKWESVVAWSTFVNTTILETPKAHWLHTLRCND